MDKLPKEQRAGAEVVLTELAEYGRENARQLKKGRWLKINEAAEAFGVCRATIHNWVKQDKVKYKQPGGTNCQIFIFVEDCND